MKPLSRLESLIAEIVERPAWLLSSRRLHPLELNAALIRALEAQALRLADRVLAPDLYTISLNTHDLAAFGGAVTALEQELAAYLARTVAERDLVCSTKPVVRITADPTVRQGKTRVSAVFAEPAEQAAPATVLAPSTRSTASKPPARKSDPDAPTAPMPSFGPVLQVERADGAVSRSLSLDRLPFVIGRSNGCDLVLPDTKVSREHARISRRSGAVVVEDLGSLNGTQLNGTDLDGACSLQDGDELQVGRARLRFRAGSNAGADPRPTRRA